MSTRERLGIALACVVLLAVFAVIRFPYARMQPAIVAGLSSASGAQVDLARCSGGLAWTGPQLRLEGLAFHFPGGDSLALDRVRVRPALSLRWLLLDPSAAVVAEGALGRVHGALGRRHLDLELEEVDLTALPRVWLRGNEAPIEGLLSAELDLVTGERGYEGPIGFSSSDGNLILPGLPLAIPFESLSGDIVLAETGDVRIETLDLDGPLVSGRAQGMVGLGSSPPLEAAALALDIELLGVEPALHPIIARYGGSLDANGGTQLRIGGTVGQPFLE